MMWSKLCGSGLLLVAGFCGGQALTKRAFRRWLALSQLRQLFFCILEAVSYQSMSGDEILLRLKKMPGLKLLRLDECRHLDELQPPLQLTAGECELFKPFLAQLGHHVGPQLCEELRNAAALCDERLPTAWQEYLKAQKLYVPLGLCAAAMVLILTF